MLTIHLDNHRGQDIDVDLTEELGQVALALGLDDNELISRRHLAAATDGVGVYLEANPVGQHAPDRMDATACLAFEVVRLRKLITSALDVGVIERQLAPYEARAIAAALEHHANELDRYRVIR